jgi:predicted anti-sigma-YlaC factor YlaD
VTCERATQAIARAIEGRLPPSLLDPLVDHLENCAPCRADADTQLSVKRLLAHRPDESVPAVVAERLAARLAVEPPPRVRPWLLRAVGRLASALRRSRPAFARRSERF